MFSLNVLACSSNKQHFPQKICFIFEANTNKSGVIKVTDSKYFVVNRIKLVKIFELLCILYLSRYWRLKNWY